jgi:hypothetical protein
VPVKFYQYGALQQLMLRCSSILSLIPAINIPIFWLAHFGILEMCRTLTSSPTTGSGVWLLVNRVKRHERQIWAWREAVRDNLRQGNGIRCDRSDLCPEHHNKQARHHHSEKKL